LQICAEPVPWLPATVAHATSETSTGKGTEGRADWVTTN